MYVHPFTTEAADPVASLLRRAILTPTISATLTSSSPRLVSCEGAELEKGLNLQHHTQTVLKKTSQFGRIEGAGSVGVARKRRWRFVERTREDWAWLNSR